MPERAAVDGFVVRRLDVAEAQALGGRLRAIFRDAVIAAGPPLHSPEQVAAWSASADNVERWAPRLAEGLTWIAATHEAPTDPVAFAMRHPADYVDLLFVDPAFHRRGLGRALLDAVEAEARDEGTTALSVHASLISYPLFTTAGYALVAWEEVEHRGVMFRRAAMKKDLT